MRKVTRILSVILSIVLLIQIMPTGVWAVSESTKIKRMLKSAALVPAGPGAAKPLTAEQAAVAGAVADTKNNVTPIIGEVLDMRSENTKHFRHQDGTYTAAMYNEPVHFQAADGTWQEIDNTLILNEDRRSAAGKAAYTPVASGLDIRVPQEFSDDQRLIVEKDGYSVGLGVSARNQHFQTMEDKFVVEEEPLDPQNEPFIPEDKPLVPEESADAPVLEATTIAYEEPSALEDVEDLPLSSGVTASDVPEERPILNHPAERKFIDLSAIKAEVNNDYTINNKAANENPEQTEAQKIEAANAEKMELGNLSSAVTYRNIFPGADLEYIVTPGRMKENIIVKEAQEQYEYLFDLSLGGLIPAPQENGSIYLLKEATDTAPLFVLEAPYMFDAADQSSTALKMSLADDGTLTLIADAAWINAEERVFPVVIDPTLNFQYTSSIQNIYVNSDSPTYNFFYLVKDRVYVGKPYDSVNRTYIKFDLPSLPSGSVVTNAYLNMTESSCNPYTIGSYICVFDCTGKSNWSINTITWNNQPLSSAINGPRNNGTKIIDYKNPYDNSVFDFNITKTVINWYENSNNNGLMLSLYNENDQTQVGLHSIMDVSPPVVQIAYNTNVGLESYWPYETYDMGRSGTAYVNDYNGNLTWVHNDVKVADERLPINISHVYNTNRENSSGTFLGMKLGEGFRLNIMEQFIPIAPGDLYNKGYRYKYIDGDGTVHYFCLNGLKITHEYDSTQVLTEANGILTLTDSQDNQKHYDINLDGYLFKIEDSNGNAQTITWTSNRISKVEDMAGREVSFGYDANGYLVSITDPAGRNTAFMYGLYLEITYPDGKITKFYTSDGFDQVFLDDGSLYNFLYNTYNTNITPQIGKRIMQISHHDKANWGLINSQTFNYSSNATAGSTVVQDIYGKRKSYFFDKFGRAVSVTNQDGQTQYSDYYSAVGNQFNKIKGNSELQTISSNLLMNPGFEQNTYWYVSDVNCAGYSLDASFRGNRSMKMTHASTSCWEHVLQGFVAEAGETYNLSADFYIPEALQGTGGATLGLTYSDSKGNRTHVLAQPIKSTNGWERYSFTYTFPTYAAGDYNVVITQNNVAGTFYFDNVQLEKSGGARYYNLLENSNFSKASGKNAEGWIPGILGGYNGNDGVELHDGRNQLKMVGTPDTCKYIGQKVELNAQSGETLIIGGKASAFPVVKPSNVWSFGIYATLYDASGTAIVTSYDDQENPVYSIYIPFDHTIANQSQVAATSHTLEEDCSYVVYCFIYYNQANEAWFDEAFVYVGNFGTNYEYNNDGRLQSAGNDIGDSMEVAYDPITNDVEKIEQTQCGIETNTVEFEYDSNHNLISSTDSTGVETEYAYNAEGQMISRTITKDTLQTIETMSYLDGFPESYTDALDKTTTYEYNIMGLKTKETDPNGNETIYTYNLADELISTKGYTDPENPNTVVSTQLALEDHVPKTITRGNMVYSYDYDALNRVTAAKVGGQTLVSNTYDARQRLAQQTFANGATYTPLYDDPFTSGSENARDLLVGDMWNGTQTVSYYYNENDRLSLVWDYTTGLRKQYGYTFDGLLENIVGNDGTQTKLGYDIKGLLSSLTFTKNDAIIHDAWYSSDNQGRPTKASLFSLGGASLSYNYDEMGRLTGRSLNEISTELEYVEGPGGNVTELVSRYKNEDAYAGVLQQYDYEYDDNGNILSVADAAGSVANYTYDGLDRLTSENDLTYEYNGNGNLTSISQNNSTVHTYAYSNANWKDQLTAFDGKTITYDALGNPLIYDGKTFNWQRGRQLTGIGGGGDTIGYTYDAAGLRTSKTVNNVTTTYTYADNTLMRQQTGGDVLDFAYDMNGKAVGFTHNGTPYYYLRNLQGDVVAIVDSESTIVAEYEYDAWGNVTITYDAALAELNPIRYRGYYYDVETGYYWLQTRYYSPEWRRFLNADSTFIAGEDVLNGSNMYAYCNNNPVMYSDPSGRGVIGSILSWIGGVLSNVADWFEDLGNKARPVMNAIGNVFDGLGKFWGGLGSLFESFLPGLEAAQTILASFIPLVNSFDNALPDPSSAQTGLGGAMLALASLALPITGAIYGVISGALWFCEGMTTLSYLKSNFFADMAYVFGVGSGGSWFIGADGDIIEPDEQVQSSPSPNGGPGLQGIYKGVKRVEEVYFYITKTVNLYVIDGKTPSGVSPNEIDPIANVTWTPLEDNNNISNKLTVTPRPSLASNYVTITAPALCDVNLQAKIGNKLLGWARVVAVNPLSEPSYAAIAKYDNTFAYQRPTTSDGTGRVDLKYSPNLKVIGEYGNFFLVETWQAWEITWVTGSTFTLSESVVTRFVEKYKAGKTDPVEKQNISRVVWPTSKTAMSDFFGFRPKNSDGTYRFHYGPDIGSGGYTEYSINNVDIPVYTIMDGEVDTVTLSTGARGNYVIMKHYVSGFGEFYTIYQHLRDKDNDYEELPKKGEKFAAGDRIAYMGASGNFRDPAGNPKAAHLHFEMMRVLPNASSGYSDYSINPLIMYCNPNDKRDTRIKISDNPLKWNELYNPQPFFNINGDIHTFNEKTYKAVNFFFSWQSFKEGIPFPNAHSKDGSKFYK